MYEVSTSGEWDIARGWDNDYSNFTHLVASFLFRGGVWYDGSSAGTFAFSHTNGSQSYYHGFRAVICPL